MQNKLGWTYSSVADLGLVVELRGLTKCPHNLTPYLIFVDLRSMIHVSSRSRSQRSRAKLWPETSPRPTNIKKTKTKIYIYIYIPVPRLQVQVIQVSDYADVGGPLLSWF